MEKVIDLLASMVYYILKYGIMFLYMCYDMLTWIKGKVRSNKQKDE